MKPISTLKTLLAGSLLLISILTGCEKDPQPIPEDVYRMDAPHTAAADTLVSRDVPSSRP